MSIEKKGPVVLARVEETQIAADSADEFRSRILAEAPEENGRIAVDLSGVEFVDSSGLGALVTLLKAVRPGGDLVLFGVRSSVEEILRLTHLDAVFGCQSDEASALSSLLQGLDPAGEADPEAKAPPDAKAASPPDAAPTPASDSAS